MKPTIIQGFDCITKAPSTWPYYLGQKKAMIWPFRFFGKILVLRFPNLFYDGIDRLNIFEGLTVKSWQVFNFREALKKK